jgi:hypothetical protein
VHSPRTRGRPDASRHDGAPLLYFEKTTQLVTTGVFKYIRHPLYSSLLLLAWGVFFKHPSWVGFRRAAHERLVISADRPLT